MSSEVSVLTVAGLIANSRAISTRGINPDARTLSKICWRNGRAASVSGVMRGPQPVCPDALTLIWLMDPQNFLDAEENAEEVPPDPPTHRAQGS
jgi:hypothetical protein